VLVLVQSLRQLNEQFRREGTKDLLVEIIAVLDELEDALQLMGDSS